MFELVCGSIYTADGTALQEKSERSTSVRSVNSVTPFGKKTVTAKTSNLPAVKII